ncbi:glycosyltransferase [Pedobacter sp. Leaf250]|uniref:glycosyltransferase n=1 Tax=Pedobacter sp. Leaf250 TaxID=2876559 RepID=UPI001E2A78C7|nr:glycosyltransferase [Pedobacter sp. Leaf250]
MADFTIAFYVHHHGSGHLMRTMQIIKALGNYPILLMGSGLKKLIDVPSNVQLVHLPLDIASTGEKESINSNSSMACHYAPLGIKGGRDRVAIMTKIFSDHFPMILIVDVSVEVTLLARLAGVPTIVMHQHGKRQDLPHQLAYDSAELLIAPYPLSIYMDKKNEYFAKTVFAGGFSKFDELERSGEINSKRICILIGNGGTSINDEVLNTIASACSDYEFHVLGLCNEENDNPVNLKFHGNVDNPHQLLDQAHIIIGNTGHNTVMETASLNKRFIGIPESRPFDEQIEKAKAIENRSGITIVLPEELLHANWPLIISELSEKMVDWNGVINSSAMDIIAKNIIKTAKKCFQLA